MTVPSGLGTSPRKSFSEKRFLKNHLAKCDGPKNCVSPKRFHKNKYVPNRDLIASMKSTDKEDSSIIQQ